MSVYAVGDVQGCLEPLQRLLDAVAFEPARDRLWLTGDLVNRGPDSLGVLRFVRGLGSAAVSVLGNHDLHLLAVALGDRTLRSKDTFGEVLDAPDRDELVNWMRHWPLLHHDAALGYSMVHAGIPPQWDLATARARASEVEQVLRSSDPHALLAAMYGDEPRQWHDDLQGGDRLRVITNYFTRMRFCSPAGELDLHSKHAPEDAPPGMAAWFSLPQRRTRDEQIIFGHWATLRGRANTPNIHALDTGCVYGSELTLLELVSDRRRCVPCEGHWVPKQQWL